MRTLGLKEAPGSQSPAGFGTGDRLILAYNPDRAAEDAALRQALRDPRTAAIARGSVRPLLKGYRRYVVTDGTTVRLNTRAFQEDAR
jgi:hypothetical protein